MCVLPVQCKRCKAVFDLWYDLQQQEVSGEGILLGQQKINDLRMESLCWRCRQITIEEAKFRQYEENDYTDDNDFELEFE